MFLLVVTLGSSTKAIARSCVLYKDVLRHLLSKGADPGTTKTKPSYYSNIAMSIKQIKKEETLWDDVNTMKLKEEAKGCLSCNLYIRTNPLISDYASVGCIGPFTQ
jgi:hypothetical protein